MPHFSEFCRAVIASYVCIDQSEGRNGLLIFILVGIMLPNLAGRVHVYNMF